MADAAAAQAPAGPRARGRRLELDTGFPSHFRGGFLYTDNASFLSLINGDTFDASVSLTRNTGGGEIDGARIGASLSCGNTPQFTIDETTVAGHSGATATDGGFC